MSTIEKLKIENAQLKAQVIGQQKEIVTLTNHLSDLRTLINRFTESNMTLTYKPIAEQKAQTS